jgi:hypothetical protein
MSGLDMSIVMYADDEALPYPLEARVSTGNVA